MQELQQIINITWENRDLLKNKENQDAIRKVVDMLDLGELRVAEIFA